MYMYLGVIEKVFSKSFSFTKKQVGLEKMFFVSKSIDEKVNNKVSLLFKTETERMTKDTNLAHNLWLCGQSVLR